MQYQVKYCKDCGEPISDTYHNTLGSHNAMQYCPKHRKEHIRASKAKWAKNHREEERIRRQKVRWGKEDAREDELHLYRKKDEQLKQQEKIIENDKKIIKKQEQYIDAMHDQYAQLRAKNNSNAKDE